MKPDALLIRAIGAEFAKRKLKSIVIPVYIVLAIVLAAAIYLVTISAWWLLIALPVVLVTVAVIVLTVLSIVAIRVAQPTVNRAQLMLVAGFVDKLERVAEHVQTPLPLIALRVIVDMVRKPERTFIGECTEDGTTLHSDYLQLRRDISL